MAQRFLAWLTAAMPFATPQPNTPESLQHEEIDICRVPSFPWYEAPEPPLRSNFFNGGAGFLVTYPSLGGLVMSSPSPVDLQHLNIPRTHDTKRSSDQAQEDDLATRMLRLGANWWPDWDTYVRHRECLDSSLYYDFPPDVSVGYPSDGVGAWVAKFPAGIGRARGRGLGGRIRGDDGRDEPARRARWDERMRMVLSMDEKCEAMEDLGAVFYRRIELCPDVSKTVEEAKEKYRRYEDLSRKVGPIQQAAYNATDNPDDLYLG